MINYPAFDRLRSDLNRALEAGEIEQWEYDESIAEINDEIDDLHREECGYDGYTRGIV